MNKIFIIPLLVLPIIKGLWFFHYRDINIYDKIWLFIYFCIFIILFFYKNILINKKINIINILFTISFVFITYIWYQYFEFWISLFKWTI